MGSLRIATKLSLQDAPNDQARNTFNDIAKSGVFLLSSMPRKRSGSNGVNAKSAKRSKTTHSRTSKAPELARATEQASPDESMAQHSKPVIKETPSPADEPELMMPDELLISPQASTTSSCTMAGDGSSSIDDQPEIAESSDSLSDMSSDELQDMESGYINYNDTLAQGDVRHPAEVPGGVEPTKRSSPILIKTSSNGIEPVETINTETVHTSRQRVAEDEPTMTAPATFTEDTKRTSDLRDDCEAEVSDLDRQATKSLPANDQVKVQEARLLVKLRVSAGNLRRSSRKRHAPTHGGGMIPTPTEEESEAAGQNDSIDQESQGAGSARKRSKLSISKTAVVPDAANEVVLRQASKAKRKPAVRKAEGATTKPASSRRSRLSKAANIQSSEESKGLEDSSATTPMTPATSLLKQSSALEYLPSPADSHSPTDDRLVVEEPDPALLELSRSLTHREPLGSKPAPSDEPEVWADSRQALCETVPYFKKPQGGCHSNDHHVYSFLFDGVGHCREYMDSELIIARAGGGMESDSSGSMVQAKNQSMTEAQVLGVLNDMELQNPLVVICGNKNTGAVCQMPHKYCVLGWYKPTMVWAEKTSGKGKKSWITVKYRFEWLQNQGTDRSRPPWHAASETARSDTTAAGPLERRTCRGCARTFPQVYLESWLCLDPACARFWLLNNGQEAPSGKLDYNPAFLLHRTPWASEEQPFSVRPPLPDVGNAMGDNLRYINTRGVVCPKCGRCNPRYKWEGWHCDHPGCDWEGLRPMHHPILPGALHSPWDLVGEGPALARNKHAAGVDVSIKHVGGYKVYTYRFEGIDGRFIHAVASSKVNGERWGADQMLVEMQKADMGLERRRFNQQKMSGGREDKTPKTPVRRSVSQLQMPTPPAEEGQAVAAEELGADATAPKPVMELGDFMTAFSMNFGMPYKFVASGASKSFEDSHWSVQACRRRLNEATKRFLENPAGDADFNEELIFAYLEGQKIEYHDDGEEGLGPRIATLSLGGKAKMHLRMKTKHYVGCSKTGIVTDERPVPGSLMYEERLRHWNDLQLLKVTNKAAYQQRMHEIPKELGISSKDRNKKAPDSAVIGLGHGDIALMEGYDIQKYFEHKVVPEDCLRFAMTCRTVLENHLGDHERPPYEVKPDDGRYDSWMVDGSATLESGGR